MLIGAGAKILGNIEVGHCAKVAAGSVVLAPVPHNKTVAGVPARVVGETGCDQPSRQMDQFLPSQIDGPGRQLRHLTAPVRSAAPVGSRTYNDRRSPLHRHPSPCQKRVSNRNAREPEAILKPEEIRKLDAYFKRTFQNPSLQVKARPRKDDFGELYLGDEFLGIVFKDEDDGDCIISRWRSSTSTSPDPRAFALPDLNQDSGFQVRGGRADLPAHVPRPI